MFRLVGVSLVGLALIGACGGGGDNSRPLDQLTLETARQFGTAAAETSFGVAAIEEDYILVGATQGDLAAPAAGGRDIYIARLNADGVPVWEHQMGSAEVDAPLGVSVADDNTVYAGGYTEGDLVNPNQGSADAWIAAFSPAGEVLWRQQFGGEQWDRVFDVTAAPDGVYVSGYTFGQVGDAPAHGGGGDGFVAKLTVDGNVEWITQLGTDANDWGQGSALAPDGGVYVTGYTEGDFDGTNAGRRDAFIARLDPDGDLLWVRQFGSDDIDWTQGVTTDGDGNVFVAGFTEGTLGDTPTAERDGVIASYTPDGDQRFVAQLGTDAIDNVFALRVVGGRVYATGGTEGSFDVANAGERDAILAVIDSDSGEVLRVLQVGTAGFDDLSGIDVTDGGDLRLSGYTFGDLMGANAGEADLFVAAVTLGSS